MRLPRDLAGKDLIQLLGRHYGYRLRRSRGSHMLATLTTLTGRHSVTVARHRVLKVGTLGQIVSEVAAFVGSTDKDVREKLFGR